MQETLTGLRMSCMNVWIPVTGRIWKWLWHFIMYLNQLDDNTLYTANYSREEIVDGINSVSAQFGISGFEHFVDTTMV